MRTAFRRELKKVQDSKGTGTGADNLYEPTLWYYDLLLFTAQSECGRKGRATDNGEDDQLENNNTTNDEDNSEYEKEFAPPTPLNSLDDLESQTISVEDRPVSTPISLSSSSRYLPCANTTNFRKRSINKRANNSFEQKKMQVLDLAHNVLSTSNNDEDEYAIAGKRIGYQLKGVDEGQRIIAEKLISDIIFFAKMKKFTEDSSVNCKPVTQKDSNSSSLLQFLTYSSSQLNNINRSSHMAQNSQSYPTTSQESIYHPLQVHDKNEDYDTPNIRNYFNNYQPSE